MEVPPAGAAERPISTEEVLNDAYNGMYYADANTKIVFFGDPEGNSLKKFLRPYRANQESSTNVLMPTVTNLTELDPYLTVDQANNLILQSDVILVCLGDVIGDGPDNIELARTLLKLKEENPTRVILITGNRDVNKVRLGHELEPTAVSMAELTNRVTKFVGGTPDAFNDFEFAFEYNNIADFDYMFGTYPRSIASMSGCQDRVKHVLETASMGEKCGWRFLVDEYLTAKDVSIAGVSDEVKSFIYVYLVQAMSGAIDCGVPGFNNIFEELLMAGHLMACIKTPDRGTFGLTHSLPPRMLIPTDPGRIYKEQFDKTVNDASRITDRAIKSKLSPLNAGLTEFNSYLYEYAKNKADPSKKRLLLEFVSGITSGSFDVYNGINSFSGLNLPVSWQTFNKTGFELLAKTAEIQVGGKMDDLKTVTAVSHIDMNEFTRIMCSHKPQGYVGVKVIFGKQFYYCVDVSKVDEQEYENKHRYGCCFLVIDLSKPVGADDAFIGRIMMNQGQFPREHNLFVTDSSKKTHTEAFNSMDSALYANYVKSPITASTLSEWIPEPKPGNFPQNLELAYKGKQYNFTFKNGENFKKVPELTEAAVSGSGGSSTRNRRSKYPKRSARTTHKRHRISKKLARKNNKRKDKKSVRK